MADWLFFLASGNSIFIDFGGNEENTNNANNKNMGCTTEGLKRRREGDQKWWQKGKDDRVKEKKMMELLTQELQTLQDWLQVVEEQCWAAEEQLQVSEQKVRQLSIDLAHLQAQNQMLLNKIHSNEQDEIIKSNTKQLIQKLPQNSNLWWPLLAILSNGLPAHLAPDLFGVSSCAICWAHAHKGNKDFFDPLHSNISGQTCTSTSDAQHHTELKQIIDDILPVASGWDYCVLCSTYLILYKKYTKRSNFQQPFQYDYFCRYLHTLKINKSLLSSLCPHCELYCELENKTERTDRQWRNKISKNSATQQNTKTIILLLSDKTKPLTNWDNCCYGF